MKQFLTAAAVALIALGAQRKRSPFLPRAATNAPASSSRSASSKSRSTTAVRTFTARRGRIAAEKSGARSCRRAWPTSASAPAKNARGASARTRTRSSRPPHDIQVNGSTLPAGTYALFAIPQQDEWTWIFSKNHTSWGSFFYDPAEDALRVKAKPEKASIAKCSPSTSPSGSDDHATVAMKWEELAVPIDITVPNASDLYVANIRNELRNSPGFNDTEWQQAARYALDNKHPAEASAVGGDGDQAPPAASAGRTSRT